MSVSVIRDNPFGLLFQRVHGMLGHAPADGLRLGTHSGVPLHEADDLVVPLQALEGQPAGRIRLAVSLSPANDGLDFIEGAVDIISVRNEGGIPDR